MIGFQLEPEHEELRKTVTAFAREVVAPVIGDYYERDAFPYPVIAGMAQLGLFGLPFPEAYGGMGGDTFALGVALEELARVDSSVAITLEAAVCLGAMPLYLYGTDEQRTRWLPDLCSGARLAAFGLTEPGGGTDIPGGIRTRARPGKGPGNGPGTGDAEAGGAWVIDGSKAFITNAGTDITSLVTVLAITGSAGRHKELSSIIVPAGTPGFTVGQRYSKVGWCASDTRELFFADCCVPQDHLLGERGRGYAQFLRILDEGRVAIAALATGLAQGCVDECLRYVAEREAFGQHIGQFQAIRFTIANMEARAHTARLAWYDASARMLARQPVKKAAAIAKLTASDAAMANARDATQIFGGYGFMNEFPVGRFYRDAKILEIGEGTSEVQRMIIARELGLQG
jgi:short/branched chain acyl-CoA dehydrogenase